MMCWPMASWSAASSTQLRPPVGSPVDVDVGYGHHEDEARATHGYEPTREAAMAAFAKSWRRE